MVPGAIQGMKAAHRFHHTGSGCVHRLLPLGESGKSPSPKLSAGA